MKNGDYKDRLEIMFEKQKVLQQRLNGSSLPKLLPNKIPITVTSIIAELGEILENCQHWKDWKKNPKEIDIDNLREEVSDLWHFVINLSLYLGINDNILFDEFIKKNKVNHIRQDNNY